MTEPTTLGELLTDMERIVCMADSDYDNASLRGYRKAAEYDAVHLRRILYGTDEPCQRRGMKASYRFRHGYEDCPDCHGTGRIKTPGLLYRVEDAALDIGWHQALRREIGEATP